MFANQFNHAEFKQSGFLQNFKKRHGIIGKVISGESESSDPAVCDLWRTVTLPKLLEKYSLIDVFNADELALFYRAIPTRSLTYTKENCKGGKMVKERVTFLLFANTAG